MTKGIYVLAISIEKDIEINVGALGNVRFAKGLYAYVGSAHNSLERRIERHLRKSKLRFWHIDHLLDDENTRVLEVFCKETGEPEECKVAEALNQKSLPVKGFGSSDCKCAGHLFKLQSYETLKELMHKACMHSYYYANYAL